MFKKIIIFALTLVMSVALLSACGGGASGGAADKEITADFTDPTFLSFVYHLTKIEEGKPIRASDVADIDIVNLSFWDIYDLSGLEHFTSMRVFICQNEELKNVDLTPYVALEYLDIQGADWTEIDVSKNVNLVELNIRLTDIAAIDLSNNPALENLDIAHTPITEIDLSHNPALKMLDIRENGVLLLDITHNTALEELYYGFNFDNDGELIGLDESRTKVELY